MKKFSRIFVFFFLWVNIDSPIFSSSKKEETEFEKEKTTVDRITEEIDFFFQDDLYKLSLDEDLSQDGQIVFSFLDRASYYKSEYFPISSLEETRIHDYSKGLKKFLLDVLNLSTPASDNLKDRKKKLYDFLKKESAKDEKFKETIQNAQLFFPKDFLSKYKFYFFTNHDLEKVQKSTLPDSLNEVTKATCSCEYKRDDLLSCGIDFSSLDSENPIKKTFSHKIFSSSISEIFQEILLQEFSYSYSSKSILYKIISSIQNYLPLFSLLHKTNPMITLDNKTHTILLTLGSSKPGFSLLREGTLDKQIIFYSGDPIIPVPTDPNADKTDSKTIYYQYKISYKNNLPNTITDQDIRDYLFNILIKEYDLISDTSISLDKEIKKFFLGISYEELSKLNFSILDTTVPPNTLTNIPIPIIDRSSYHTKKLSIQKTLNSITFNYFPNKEE